MQPRSRRRFLFSAAALALGGAAPLRLLAQSAVRPYILLPDPQPTESPGKIEVIEFFSYGCPHCNEFNPIFKRWIARQPATVAVRRLPVSWGAAWSGLARLYYTLEQTGDLERLDDAVFAALHEQRLRIYDEKNMTKWYVKQGGEEQKFKAAFNSFSVQNKQNRADAQSKAMKIESVPSLVVEGKYLIQGNSLQQQLIHTEALIAQLQK
jgi:thiol:disulfide interchange protein DsbA